MGLDFPHGDEKKHRLTNDCELPSHYYIDIGNLCNLRCPFCVQGGGMDRKRQGFMSLANFRVVLGKIRDSARLIALYNWGEPLLNRDLLPIIREVADAGIHAHIDTNLTLRDLSDEEAQAIVRSGLRTLFVSADGVTQEVYEKYRVRGDVNRVFHNIQQLQDAKRALKSELPLIGWQYYVHAFNEHEMGAARQIARVLKIPIVFKLLSVPDASWHSSYHAGPENFLDGREWFYSTYNPIINAELSSVPLHPNISYVCKQLFQSMIVEWNGDVLPCTCVSGPSYAMGNLLRDDLREVWNGGQFRASREFILNYGPKQGGHSVCENCACALTRKWAVEA